MADGSPAHRKDAPWGLVQLVETTGSDITLDDLCEKVNESDMSRGRKSEAREWLDAWREEVDGSSVTYESVAALARAAEDDDDAEIASDPDDDDEEDDEDEEEEDDDFDDDEDEDEDDDEFEEEEEED